MNTGLLAFRMIAVITFTLIGLACAAPSRQVPHEERWGIYSLKLDTQAVELLFSSPSEIAALQLNHRGDRLVFAQTIGGSGNEYTELFILAVDDDTPQRLTNNTVWDLYPTWSADDSRIAFLSWRHSDLDIYVMNVDGSDQTLLYDSGSHDADIHWVGDQIVFTAFSRIWIMNSDGTNVRALTDPPRAGEWGSANLPFGDYDPRLSPDGTQIVFERLVADASPHGNYDLFQISNDGAQLTQLTETGYSQGLASWSHDGERLVYVVAAVGETGKYDLYMINADGTGNKNITPSFFPPTFLCHSAVFSSDDTALYFIGEWWSPE